MICATNGLPWLKASSTISHGSFFSHALFGIFSFIGMTSFLMTLPLTSKFVSPWYAKVLLYGCGLIPAL
jgi:hypothetical protein